MLNCPPAPDTRDCGRGVDQHSVQIEKQGRAVDLDHWVGADTTLEVTGIMARAFLLAIICCDCKPKNFPAGQSGIFGGIRG